MVRNYKKKIEREVNEDDMETAIMQVIGGHMKLRQAADTFKIKANTLHYRIKKYKEETIPKNVDYTTKYTVAQVFTNYEENLLKGYLLKSSKMNYGLTYKQAKVLAFEYATALKKCPPLWTTNKQAGIDWLKGFMKRHRELSLRKPENTSLSRSTSFNKHNVNQFYDNYEKVLKKYYFTSDRIFNIDETNIMTVVQAPNVIAQTGVKQVGQSVSAERGQLITMCSIGKAIGNFLPPVFIFPRARYHEAMIRGGPPGCIGFANSPTSGWMTGPLFIKVLEHIKKLARCSKDDPILLLMDNHESHCTLDAINYCRDNGMIVVTFPPHCTHRMQPLDVAVNGPFKQKLAVAQNDWLVTRPGKTITIHDLASIVTPAYNVSYTARNIISGFEQPGLFPFSRNAFTDEDFECAEVTDRPLPPPDSREATQRDFAHHDAAETSIILPQDPTSVENLPVPLINDDLTDCEDFDQDQNDAITQRQDSVSPSIITDNNLPSQNNSLTNQTPIIPESVRPFPKAPPRKLTGKGRKKGRSRILTDTPEKEEIQKAYLERQARLQKACKLRKQKGAKGITSTKSKKSVSQRSIKKSSKPKRPKLALNFSSSETDTEIHLESEEEVIEWSFEVEESDDDNEKDPNEKEIDYNAIAVDTFVLAELASEKNAKRKLAFVGKVIEKDGSVGFLITFLKKKGGLYKFFFPDKPDHSYVSTSDILAILPSPEEAAGTSRTAAMLKFKFNFDAYNLG